MAKKEYIDIEIYKAKQLELEGLLLEVPKVEINASNCNEYHIDSLPNERVIFIDKEYMNQFEPFLKYNVRSVKFINYGKVAMSLKFNKKHKYAIKKNIDNELILGLIEDAIKAKKRERAILPESSEERIKAITKDISSLNEIHQNIDNYDCCISNYYRFYTYGTAAWRFINQLGKIESANNHLIKDKNYSDEKHIEKRYNVIFVDSDALKKVIPYQNKTVEKFLSKFENKIELTVSDLFFIKK